MPNSLQSSAAARPPSGRATNCSLSSITEHSFQGIIPSPLRGESVTYVSGTMCYLCLRPLKGVNWVECPPELHGGCTMLQLFSSHLAWCEALLLYSASASLSRWSGATNL